MKFATPALRLGTLSAAIALAMAPSLAAAQDADGGATTLDRMEVPARVSVAQTWKPSSRSSP